MACWSQPPPRAARRFVTPVVYRHWICDDMRGSDLNLFSRGIAVKPCGTPRFERARSAIAVFEKLNVRDLIPFETRQEGKRRCNFLPCHIRFVGKRAEEGDAATLLNGVGDFEVECFPAALDCPKYIGQFLRSLVRASPGLNFLQFRVVEVQ